jgi:hypothetical protein
MTLSTPPSACVLRGRARGARLQHASAARKEGGTPRYCRAAPGEDKTTEALRRLQKHECVKGREACMQAKQRSKRPQSTVEEIPAST